MKYRMFLILLLTMAGVATIHWSCQDDEFDNTLEAPFSKLEGINGSWEIRQIEHVDYANPLFDLSYDVSEVLVGDSPLVLTFNIESGTYEVQSGSSKHQLGNSGSWSFDDPEFPTELVFQTDEGQTIQGILENTVRVVDNELIFQFSVNCSDLEEPQHGFKYTFDRVVQ